MRKLIEATRFKNMTIKLEMWFQGNLKDYMVMVYDYNNDLLFEEADMSLKEAREVYNVKCQESGYKKVEFTIKNTRSEWKETFYMLKDQDPEEYGKKLMKFFNGTLRQNELPREIVKFISSCQRGLI